MGQSRSQAIVRQVEIPYGEKRITGRCDAGDISMFGGLILFCLLEMWTGMIARAARCIKDNRRRNSVKHTIFRLLFERVSLIALGYPAALDFNHFRFDPMMQLALKLAIGDDEGAASQSTISRLEESVTAWDLKRLFVGFINEYVRQLDKNATTVTIKLDGSAMPAYGIQQYIAFNAHYDMSMYYPTFAFDEKGWLIAPLLRSGNVNDGVTAIPMLNHIVKRVRRRLPHVRITVLADAAFNSDELFTWCEDNKVFYVIAGESNNNLNNDSQDTDRKAVKQFVKQWGPPLFHGPDGGKAKFKAETEMLKLNRKMRRGLAHAFRRRIVRRFSDFMHRAGNGVKHTKKRYWTKDRRAIGLARVTDRGLKRRYLFTNINHFTAQHIYDVIYASRSCAEQCIREFKSFEMCFSASEFVSNQLRLFFAGLAYNLINSLKRSLSPRFRTLSAETVRRLFLLIPVQVQDSTRRIWLRWTSHFPHQSSFLNLIDRLRIRSEPLPA
jgi:hypothetical protein